MSCMNMNKREKDKTMKGWWCKQKALLGLTDRRRMGKMKLAMKYFFFTEPHLDLNFFFKLGYIKVVV